MINIKIPKLSSLRSPSIGHLVLNTMRYLDINVNEKIIIITKKKNIVNYEIYKIIKNHYQSKNVKFIHSRILLLVYKILYRVKKKLPFLNNFFSNIEWYHHEVDFEKNFGAMHRFYDDRSFQLKSKIEVLDEQKDKFDTWRKSNLPNGKFVVFFSRDAGYYKDKNNPRNSDFKKYKKSIDYLIQKGFFVIRMGRFHEKNFVYNNKNYFDYSEICKNNYDDLIELMIFKNCEFMVGSVTGLLAYNTLFDKPLLINNWFPAGYVPWFRNSTYITKIYKKNGRIINFNQIPKNILLSENEKLLKSHSINILENSEEEIFQQIKNFINFGLNCSIDLGKRGYLVCGSGSKLDKFFFEKYKNLF